MSPIKQEQRHAGEVAVLASPLTSSSGSSAAATGREVQQALARFARVLVVDDDDALRRSLCRLFRRTSQIEAGEAKTVAEAIQLLAREPELVITDVRLPDGSGHQVVELAASQRPAPLVVAMSGLASAREAFALAQCGARLYLTKPFAEQELLDVIVDVCSELPLPAATIALTGRGLSESLALFGQYYGIPERELALVRLATAGVPRTRCPELLGITENTCKTLTRRLLQRCGARSLAQIPRLVLMGDSCTDEPTGRAGRPHHS